jgi:L-alanine-DL-glutamate epimerase-like enolase superfamily enzyme
MKIGKVESFAVKARPIDREAYWGSRAWSVESHHKELSAEYPAPQRRKYIYSQTIDTVLVRLTTDDGIVGWGEAKAPVAPEVTKNIIDLLLAPIVIGSDPREVSVLWERMYAGMRVRGHRAGFYLEAMSGVDIAIWDLLGHIHNSSVTSLLGGAFRNPVRVYASGLPTLASNASAEELEKLVRDALQIRDNGFTGLKLAMGRDVHGDIRCAQLLRERLGSDFLLYADAAGVYDRSQALWLGRRLEEIGAVFFEMPIPPEDIEGYSDLAQKLDIPIALDSLTSRHETLEFLRRKGLDIVQPDVCRAGGISECRRIAELADAFGVAFAPHVSIGSLISFAASVHLGASMPNTLVMEYWIGVNPLGDGLFEQSLRMEQGYLYSPDRPGLGVQLNMQALKDLPVNPAPI